MSGDKSLFDQAHEAGRNFDRMTNSELAAELGGLARALGWSGAVKSPEAHALFSVIQIRLSGGQAPKPSAWLCPISREIGGYRVWPCHLALSILDARGGLGLGPGRQVSVSRIQRRCGLGYGHAHAVATLVTGAISPARKEAE